MAACIDGILLFLLAWLHFILQSEKITDICFIVTAQSNILLTWVI